MESRKGWREFKCSECGMHWKIATRDCSSPSMEICPNRKCESQGEPPINNWVDENLSVDEMGNLTFVPEAIIIGE